MKTFVVEGIVLKRRNIGEADRILTVFTKHNGKMLVKAVGVRKITSKRSPYIEPLSHAVMSIYKGKGMPILTEIEAKESFSDIKTDLTTIGFAYHLCELVDGLCPEGQENSTVFNLLLKVLYDMSKTENLPMTIHEFEIALLLTLGYLSERTTIVNTASFIERILERRLKTFHMLPKLLASSTNLNNISTIGI